MSSVTVASQCEHRNGCKDPSWASFSGLRRSMHGGLRAQGFYSWEGAFSFEVYIGPSIYAKVCRLRN